MLLKKNIKLKLIALIPARGGSKRFPKKNIAKFLNKPLISYPIEEALKSKIFSDVIVSTDNTEIKKIARKFGANTVTRSKKSASDKAHELEACREYLTTLKRKKVALPDYFCVIYPTAVLVKSIDFKSSFKLFKADRNIDVVMGVSNFNYHPYKALSVNKKGYLTPVFKTEHHKRSQTYKNMFASNGSFYWHNTKSFLDKKYLGHYAKNLIGYTMISKISMDIDFQKDLDDLNFFYGLKNK